MLTLFWMSIFIVFYTYIGYGAIVGTWSFLLNKSKSVRLSFFEPEVTLIIPAYNEGNILVKKILNCQQLDYPSEKLTVLFITDGSNDQSVSILANYSSIQHLHISERAGKSMAENRAMLFVKTPYVVFTDCNTLLNNKAIRNLLVHYQDSTVGAVSGEKRILRDGSAAGNGEGLYWKYESFLKKCDSTIYSLMGAAGELVSFRTSLFKPLEQDTILDDFIQSMRIVGEGYRVIYEPEAYATELPSSSLQEEMSRKVRICAGGWQSMVRLSSLLNPFKRPIVTFLYISHRVLRWSLTPLLLAILLPLNAYVAYRYAGIYLIIFSLQIAFYILAGFGWILISRAKRVGAVLLPMYFTMMNVAAFRGFNRFIRNSQPAAWDKAQRISI